jgi:hypothetical protein
MAISATSTFSDIMNVAQFRDDDHKNKALKADTGKPLYQGSSVFSQATQKSAGASFIKGSLDREFGNNFGARVFARASTYQHGLNLGAVVKGRDLALIDRASRQLRAEDTVGDLRRTLGEPARGITGAQVQSLLAVISDPKVGDGTKLQAEGILREAVGHIDNFDGMKAALTVGNKTITPQQLDQLVHLKKGNGDPSFTLEEQTHIQEAVTPGAGGNTAGNRASLAAQLPPGVVVNVNGTVGGTTTLNSIGGDFPKETGKPTPTFVDVMDHVGQQSLKGEGVRLSNGLTIGTQADKDLYRLNLTIKSGDGPPYSSVTARTQIKQEHGDGEVPKRTNVSITNAMQTLTNGSAPAVRVLSSVINQQFSTPFVRGMNLGDGSKFSPAVAGLKDGNQPVGTDTGIEMRPPGGIGSSNVNITRLENGNYKVDISYPFTLKRPSMEHGAKFDGCGDTAIQGTGQVSFTIDGTQAAHGKLAMVQDGPATVTWSGHMSLD